MRSVTGHSRSYLVDVKHRVVESAIDVRSLTGGGGGDENTCQLTDDKSDSREICVLHSPDIELELSTELDVSTSVYLYVNLGGVEGGVRVHSNDLFPQDGVTIHEVRFAAVDRDIGVLDDPEVYQPVVLPAPPAGIRGVIEGRAKRVRIEHVAPRLQSQMLHLVSLDQVERSNDIINKCHQGLPFIKVRFKKEPLSSINVIGSTSRPDGELPQAIPLIKLTNPIDVLDTSVDNRRYGVIARGIQLEVHTAARVGQANQFQDHICVQPLH